MVRALTLLAAILATAALAACGNATNGPSGTDSPSNLIRPAEIDKAKAGGVEQAFLEFWSALQFQAWAEAASFYAAPLRDSVGTAAIIGAKKLNAPSYPRLKPSVQDLSKRGGLTTIKYSLRLEDGTQELTSIAWRNQEGNWEIVYDSRLDAELGQAAQNTVELARSGVLPTDLDEVSPAANRAGGKAALAQARFLERRLALTSR
jgi:hypothetical protein